MNNSGWITYYWCAASKEALQMILDANAMPNLGIAQGGVAQMTPDLTQPLDGEDNHPMTATGVVFGNAALFYTVARSQTNMKTPTGLTLAEPFDCTGLLGVFA